MGGKLVREESFLLSKILHYMGVFAQYYATNGSFRQFREWSFKVQTPSLTKGVLYPSGIEKERKVSFDGGEESEPLPETSERAVG